MVSPDGTRPEVNRREVGRTALFAGAALLIAVGFVVLGSLTAPEEPIAAETTTSSTSTTVGEILPPIDMDDFSIGQVAAGEPLAWTRVDLTESGYPVGLFEHEDAVYLFATSNPVLQFVAGGLTGWRTTDGTTWEPLGQLIGDEYNVSMVTSTEHGLLAAGTPADGSSLMVWMSSDGRRWIATEISGETEDFPSKHFPMAIGSNSDLLVVAGDTDLNLEVLLEERLDAAGVAIDLSENIWSTEWRGEQGHWLTIDGPLGMRALEVDLDELDLTEQEIQWVVNGYGGTQQTLLWVRQGGEEHWNSVSIDGVQWVESIVTRADGTLIFTGWAPAGRISRQSRDGVSWTHYDANQEPIQMQSWGDRFIGVLYMSRPELLVSDDAVSWDPTGLADHFPPPIQWSVQALGSGDDGIALSVIGYHQTLPPEEPVVIREITTSEGHTLTLDLEQRIMEVTVGDTTRTWEIFGRDLDEGVEVDAFERTVTLSDPHTGETLTELSFEELREAEHAYYTERFHDDEHQALVFTTDGFEWIIQSATDAIGEDTWVRFLEVATGRVYAAVLEPASVYNPYADPGFELWVAEIP